MHRDPRKDIGSSTGKEHCFNTQLNIGIFNGADYLAALPRLHRDYPNFIPGLSDSAKLPLALPRLTHQLPHDRGAGDARDSTCRRPGPRRPPPQGTPCRRSAGQVRRAAVIHRARRRRLGRATAAASSCARENTPPPSAAAPSAAANRNPVDRKTSHQQRAGAGLSWKVAKIACRRSRDGLSHGDVLPRAP